MGKRGPSPNTEIRRRALALRLEGRSYSEIGRELGIRTQEALRLIRPDQETRERICRRANNACEICGAALRMLHVHHRATVGTTPETYNRDDNLTLLCVPCHRAAHADPSLQGKYLKSHAPHEITDLGAKRGASRLGITADEWRHHRENGERWCTEHRDWEPSERFGRSRLSRDGLGGLCLEGQRAYNQKWRARRRAERAS